MLYKISLLLLSAALIPTYAESGFQREDYQRLKFKIWMESAPPVFSEERDYPRTSPLYPATSFFTDDIKSLNTTAPSAVSGVSFDKYYRLLANVHGPSNAYPHQGHEPSALFSSSKRANICTKLQALRVLGGDMGKIEDQAKDAGLTHWDSHHTGLAQQAKAQKLSSGKTVTALMDICVLEDMSQAPDAAGLVLDLPATLSQDEIMELLRQLKSAMRPYSKKLVVRLAPAIDKKALHAIAELVDNLILALPVSRWLKLDGDLRSKFILALDPTQISVSEAEQARAFVLQQKVAGIEWLKAPDANRPQAVRCLAFGECAK
jgi:hypothetical protein